MSNSTRTGRRRRLLHDGAATAPTPAPESAEPGTRVRFTPPAQSASYALASRALPRTPVTLAGGALALVAITLLVAWVGVAAAPSDSTGLGELLRIGRAGSLAAWWEASLWLAVAGQCVLLFGMRRHRTDDVAGTYHGWLLAAGLATALSAASATHAHAAVASQLAAWSGFQPAAIWWVGPALLAAAAAGVGIAVEVRECRLAGSLACGAGVALAVATAAATGVVPASLGSVVEWLAPPVIASMATAVGATLLLGSLVAYARRIVRETLGEVSPPAATRGRAEATPSAEPLLETEPAGAGAPVADESDDEAFVEEDEDPSRTSHGAARKQRRGGTRPRLADSTTGRWVNGLEDFEEDYDDEAADGRKRAKSERRRERRDRRAA